MSVVNKIWGFLKPIVLNKYLIVLISFGVFITFFDDHNLIHRWETQRKIKELEKEYQYYQNEIKSSKMQMKKLQTDDGYLEKFAREKYHMKSEDEDIFIIKE